MIGKKFLFFLDHFYSLNIAPLVFTFHCSGIQYVFWLKPNLGKVFFLDWHQRVSFQWNICYCWQVGISLDYPGKFSILGQYHLGKWRLAWKSSGRGAPSRLTLFHTRLLLASRDKKSFLYSRSKQTKHIIIKTHTKIDLGQHTSACLYSVTCTHLTVWSKACIIYGGWRT